MLETTNLTKNFGEFTAVDGVDLTVETGNIKAVIGPNGAGKTTFFNMLSGRFPPTSGTIALDGEDITGLAPADTRRFCVAPPL